MPSDQVEDSLIHAVSTTRTGEGASCGAERACSRCEGAGDVANNGSFVECRRCGGSGISPATIACPYCGAPAGEGCYRHGAHMQGQADYFHKARRVP